jgi:hypothetical protein
MRLLCSTLLQWSAEPHPHELHAAPFDDLLAFEYLVLSVLLWYQWLLLYGRT